MWLLSHRTRRAPRKASSHSTCRPWLEFLEDRSLLSAGTLDPTFGSGGIVNTDIGLKATLHDSASAVQADGRIIVVGSSFYDGPFNSYFAVARYNLDGSLDTTFGTGGKLTIDIGPRSDSAYSVAVQTDGKIVVAGYSDAWLNYDFAVARLNSDGSLDNTFDSDGKRTIDFGGSDESANGVVIQADGKIVLAGKSSQSTTGYDFALARLNIDGSLDTTLDGDGKQTIDFGSGGDIGGDVAVQPDGKLVLAGFSVQSGSGYDFAVARLNADGSLDSSFDSDGKKTIDFAASTDLCAAVKVQGDGQIVLAGYTYQATTGDNFALVRLNSDGSLDNTFDGDGKRTIDFGSFYNEIASDLAIQADGRLVVAGTTSGDFALARLNSDGSLDNTLDGDGRQTIDFGFTYDSGRGLAVQADGKVVVAGISWQGVTGYDFVVARLNSDGSLDSTFDGDGRVVTTFEIRFPTNDFARSMAVQTDGKVILAGSSFHNSTGYHVALLRYHTDGSPDSSFGTDGRVTVNFGSSYEFGTRVAVQADGKVVVAGISWQGATGYDFVVARLNNDGSLDNTFDGDGKRTIDFGTFYESAAGMVIQSDGRIVIVESNGTDFALARLNHDGSLDTSFDGDGKQTIDFGSLGDYATSVALTADGKIVVSGFSYQDATGLDFALARLNGDGSLDTSFDGDGKQTIDFGSFKDYGMSVTVQGDSKIVAAGYSYQSATGNDFAVARLNSDGSLDASFDGDGKQTIDFGSWDDVGYAVLVQAAVADNDGPTAGDDSLTTAEDSSVNGNVLANDSASDPDDQLTVVAVNGGNPEAKIIVVGYSDQGTTGVDFALARLNNDGSLDRNFDGDGRVTTDFGGSYNLAYAGMAVQADGKIVVAGNSLTTTGWDFTVARYTALSLPGEVIVTAHGQVTVNADGSFIYTPGLACEATSDSFSYTMSDGHGGSATATVTITIAKAVEDGAITIDASGVVRIGGTVGSDNIVLTANGGQLRRNGVDTAIALASVTEIRIWGREGNDTIDVSALDIKSFLHGGAGDDSLTGSSVNDVLIAGSGNDTITAGAGNDFLVGGIGIDRLIGSAGHDILVAGEIECDLNLDSLRAVSEAWSLSRTVTTESVDDFLDETVGDSNSDQLTGGSGADLFIINTGDRITDFLFGKPHTNRDGDVVILNGVVVL